jgi:putative transcriptional regulator
MNPVPSSPEPERRPAASPAAGRRGRNAAPRLSVGTLDDVRPGALLVAMPALTDPTFAGSVVYVLDHSTTGTIGVVLGRPSEVRIGDVLPGWSDLAVEPAVFHVGGPCETDTALCLATRPGTAPLPEDSGLRPVCGAVHLVDLDSDPEPLAGEIGGLRVFAGYAGWSPGQLAMEIVQGSWA